MNFGSLSFNLYRIGFDREVCAPPPPTSLTPGCEIFIPKQVCNFLYFRSSQWLICSTSLAAWKEVTNN